MASDVFFRAGVGLLIVNDAHLVLALERSDVSGSWQVPQGGLLEGEEPLQAAERELYEETGIPWSEVTVLGVHPNWLTYELPETARSEKTGRGQVQKWFLLGFRGSDTDIKLQPDREESEFIRWQWMSMAQLTSRVWEIRRPVYYALALHWHEHLV
jgi:putative (di)nucleoside polyphosphate hydrolase